MEVIQQITDALARVEVRYILTIVGSFILKRFPGVLPFTKNIITKQIPMVMGFVTGGVYALNAFVSALFPGVTDAEPAVYTVAAAIPVYTVAGFFSGFTIFNVLELVLPWMAGHGTHTIVKNTKEIKAAKAALPQ